MNKSRKPVFGHNTRGSRTINIQPCFDTGSQTRPQRARGAAILSTRRNGAGQGIDRLRTSGSLRVLFPRQTGRMEAMLINTSGGLTGGDRYDVEATAGAGTVLTLTTQAAERAYRSSSGHGVVETRLRADEDATLMWLPQEMILFDGSALRRRLSIDLATTSKLLMVEPVVFGRMAMGERQLSLEFHDRIEVRREGQPLYLDGVRIEGDATASLARPAVGTAMTAMASLLYVATDAESHVDALRSMLPPTGGVSMLHPDVLTIRLLAEDSFFLLRDLLPILDRLSQNTLPASWRL